MFTQKKDAKATVIADEYQIEKVLVDLVYGKTSAVTPDTENVLKTSLTWLESGAGRRVSGSPGYGRGKPLLIGKEYTVSKADA